MTSGGVGNERWGAAGRSRASNNTTTDALTCGQTVCIGPRAAANIPLPAEPSAQGSPSSITHTHTHPLAT